MFAPVQDPLTSLEDIIRGLMTSKLDLFVGMGQNLFRGFATIIIAWFGIQSALSSAEGGDDRVWITSVVTERNLNRHCGSAWRQQIKDRR